MDRDKRWDRTKLAYDALVEGVGLEADSAVQAVEQSYRDGVYDEFIKPTVIKENGKPVATVGENDSIILFNFRPDRARQLTSSFIDPDFNGFDRPKGYFPVYVVSMTQYDEEFKNIHVAYEPEHLINTFGEYISKHGLKQLRIAE